MSVKRVFLIILDGVGVGELPDAHVYGDQGSNTLGNLSKEVGGMDLPFLEQAGLGKLTNIQGLAADISGGVFGKMLEVSPGKDTTTGHWEMAGLILPKPFPVYPNGFPEDLISRFIAETGRGFLGNKPASGTAIIDEYGSEHLKTGSLIVYTSADSVFQIAAHEEMVTLEELYRDCEIARRIFQGEHGVGRVIARPFLGKPGSFYRTAGRKDFSLKPFGPIVLDRIKDAGMTVFGVGKIEDIFARQGLTDSNHTHKNSEALAFISELISKDFQGLVFANCVDFDMVYGHRNDTEGFYRALKEVDHWLEKNVPKLREGDLLIITADHGCDPTTASTDHSREYVPLLIFGPGLSPGVDLGVRKTFADIAASLCNWFNLEPWPLGEAIQLTVNR
ncbi:MAG: phosphopentomutase [Firmicutes bacterium]|nr:phosphopentomutase [Bacillota bacterium]